MNIYINCVIQIRGQSSGTLRFKVMVECVNPYSIDFQRVSCLMQPPALENMVLQFHLSPESEYD